jgi:hypothetical protein
MGIRCVTWDSVANGAPPPLYSDRVAETPLALPCAPRPSPSDHPCCVFDQILEITNISSPPAIKGRRTYKGPPYRSVSGTDASFPICHSIGGSGPRITAETISSQLPAVGGSSPPLRAFYLFCGTHSLTERRDQLVQAGAVFIRERHLNRILFRSQRCCTLEG